ncbi:hypothetical protein OAO01_09720, partial [Oligoflexia bacterium]|nr:hypothetical protein [Oligoflexia bacterium]
MEIISSKTNINFLGLKKYAFLLSFLMLAGSVYVWVTTGDSKFGIDYQGGHEVVVKIAGAVSSEDIRVALKKGGLESPVVQAFEAESGEYSIRLGGEFSSEEVKTKILASLKEGFSEKVEILKTDFVGPTIGKELRKKALIA